MVLGVRYRRYIIIICQMISKSRELLALEIKKVLKYQVFL